MSERRMQSAERRVQNERRTDDGASVAFGGLQELSMTRSRARAMTLMEILVVMAIISIIVAGIVVAGFAVQRRGQVHGTAGFLRQLAQGLAQYKATYRMYVPSYVHVSTGPTDPDGTNDVVPLESTIPLWRALELEGKFVSVDSQFKQAYWTIESPQGGGRITRDIYQDAWRQPLWYTCVPPFTSYTIISAGPDLIMNSGDDIIQQ